MALTPRRAAAAACFALFFIARPSSVLCFGGALHASRSSGGHLGRVGARLGGLAAVASGEEYSSDTCGSDVFVLSFDGAVAETAATNALLGIDAAIATWPHLVETIEAHGDTDWLLNKMVALAPSLGADADGMMGCDWVLLARMLLEEQELDGGRSIGCKGKYGSRFHPSSSPSGSVGRGADGSNGNGSRPLTVGEIKANWCDGGVLRETTRTRYNVEGKDPIPIIKENLIRLRELQCPVPPVNPAIVDALSSCGGNVIVTVGHKSHIPAALASLSRLPIDVLVAPTIEDIDLALGSNCITIVGPKNDREAQRDVIRGLIGSTKKSCNFFIIHGALSVLQDAKILLGDDIPQISNGFRVSKVGENVNMSLLLPRWADNVDPQKRNDAEMDPWMQVVAEVEVAELMSAKIISA